MEIADLSKITDSYYHSISLSEAHEIFKQIEKKNIESGFGAYWEHSNIPTQIQKQFGLKKISSIKNVSSHHPCCRPYMCTINVDLVKGDYPNSDVVEGFQVLENDYEIQFARHVVLKIGDEYFDPTPQVRNYDFFETSLRFKTWRIKCLFFIKPTKLVELCDALGEALDVVKYYNIPEIIK